MAVAINKTVSNKRSEELDKFMKWVGVDIGGTFTDAVVFDDETKKFTYAKAPSSLDDPASGVLDVLDSLSINYREIERFVHGVTIGTNAILQGKGAEVWMLTTRGFRDVLEIARTNRPILYDIKALKLKPLIPRTRTFEISERMRYDGSVESTIAPEDVNQEVKKIPEGGDVALAICFLHSYANPTHEIVAKQLCEKLRPDLFVCSSHEVLSQFREYERFSTTALNAFLGPLMSHYFGHLKTSLVKHGYHRDIYIMTSNGGVSTVERAKNLPISTVLSGPAGGVAGAVYLGKRHDLSNLITCDMGGTSTDVCLIEDLRIPITNEQSIAGHANRTPQIEINAVGAGGGSIAWLDAGDILKVGPQSAGADPGPACYDRGGLEPTVTDANLILNRLHPDNPLAGRIKLKKESAITAVQRLGSKIGGLGDMELAEGIIRIAVAHMVSAIKQISMASGFDPRDFTLVAYGGAGPMHAVAIAEELEMQQILVPLGPGNLAAFGSLISDLKRDHVQTKNIQVSDVEWDSIEAVFLDLESKALSELKLEEIADHDIAIERSVGMRYVGQSWQLNVDVSKKINSLVSIGEAFANTHERRFGYRSEGPTEIVDFRIAATAVGKKPDLPVWTSKGSLEERQLKTRQVYIDGAIADVIVYQRYLLPYGSQFDGPCIIEESGSTTVLTENWNFSVLDDGSLLLKATKVDTT